MAGFFLTMENFVVVFVYSACRLLDLCVVEAISSLKMSYKNLGNFKEIIQRDDFSYVCDESNIHQIKNIMLNKIYFPDGREITYVEQLKEFLTYLDSFCGWIGNGIPDINNGSALCREILARCVNLLEASESKRTFIRQRHVKRLNKLFLYGLSKILDGIRAAFDPAVITSTNIKKEQLARYFLDKTEGLGNRFVFNRAGRDGSANKLNSLEMPELIATEELLLNLPKQRRTRNGWIDYGARQDSVRVLVIPNKSFGLFGKDLVVSIFRTNPEHKAYERQLDTPINHVKFVEA